MTIAIQVEHLTKRFPAHGGDVVAVDDVSFDVSSGEVFGLLGANGAGKTTTLRMILGLLKPTSGNATVDGFRVADEPDEVKRRLALVSASAGLYQWLTARELIHFFAELYDVPNGVARERIESLVEQFDLGSFADRACSGLSTGQQQRVNLARSLIHDPPIVLLDEPTRGLDIVGSKQIFDYIDHLREQGKAVILCTHRLDEAQRLGTRFGVMHRGKLLRQGTLSELQDQTGHATLTEMFLDLLQQDRTALSTQ